MQPIRGYAASAAAAVLLVVAANATASGLQLQSDDLQAGATVPDRYIHSGHGCNGANQSPALRWSGAPEGTQSFAITVHDPDAPHAGGWWHWVVYALPQGTHALSRGASGGAMPSGVREGRNSFGQRGYGGPCPPSGDEAHRYVVTLYALNSATLDIKASTAPDKVAHRLTQHALAQATLVTHYSR